MIENLKQHLPALIRLVISVILLKIIFKSGGAANIDIIAIAALHGGPVIILNLKLLNRVRAISGKENGLRILDAGAIIISKAIKNNAMAHAIFSPFIALLVCLFYLQESNANRIILYVTTFTIISINSALTVTEYICARRNHQTIIRRMELLIYILIAAVSFALSSAYVATIALFGSTIVARLMYANKYILANEDTKLAIKQYIRRKPTHKKYIKSAISKPILLTASANLIQSISVIIVQTLAYKMLPVGVLAQINLAFRFAGPAQLVFSNQAYSAFNTLRAKSMGRLIAVTACLIIVTGTFVPYLSSTIFEHTIVVSPLMGIIAGVHITMQGICQIFGSALYGERKYKKIFLLSVPSLVTATIGYFLIKEGIISDAVGVSMILIAPIIVELTLLIKLKIKN